MATSIDLSDMKKEQPDDCAPLIETTHTQSHSKYQFTKQHKLVLGILLIIIIIAILVVVIIVFASSKPTTKPNILYIIHNESRIYTMDDPNNNIISVEAICMDTTNGRFLYIGNKEDVFNNCTNHQYNELSTLQLYKNVTIIPGLIDSHTHIMTLGENHFIIDLRDAQSTDDIYDAISTYITENEIAPNTDEWVQGWGYNQNNWNDWNTEDFPTRWMLDEHFPNYKLYLHRIDGHSVWVNTAALNSVDPLPDEDPVGGIIVRDSNGTITGILINSAVEYISKFIPDWNEQQKYEMLHIAMKDCNQNGLTSIHDAGLPASTIQLFKSVIDGKIGYDMTLRINAFARQEVNEPNDYELLFDYKDLLTVQTVKFFLDGALGSWGAALRAPYCDDPNATGILYFNEHDFYDNISHWHEYGFQISTHAIGDAANRLVIDQYIKLINEYNLTDHRLIIEHAQIVNLSYDIPRIGEYQIIPSMQPAHCTFDMQFAETRLCEYRLDGAYAWQSLLDANISALPFNSDFPNTAVNPFWSLFAAITRQNRSGYPEGGWMTENKVSRYQALKGYTYDGAYSTFQENDVGTITQGKYADFVIIDRDYFEINEMDILDTIVIATYLGGKPVYVNSNYTHLFEQ